MASRSLALTSMVLLMLIAGAGCTFSEPTDEAPGSATATSASGSEDSPVATLIPLFEDGADLAAFIAQRSAQQDWNALTQILGDRANGLRYGMSRGELVPPIGANATIGLDPSEWTTESFDSFVVARYRELTPLTIVMRRADDGTLRVDPGPCAVYRTQLWRNNPDMARLGGDPYQKALEGKDLTQIQRMFRDDIDGCVEISDTDTIVTLSWTFTGIENAQLPLQSVEWRTEERSGPVELIWTTAQVSGDVLVFPAPDGITERTAVAYTFSLRLVGSAAQDGVEVLFNDILVTGDPGQQTQFSVSYALPSMSYPQPVS